MRDFIGSLGTGKTLSMICSALQWLVDNREKEAKCESVFNSNGSDDEPDWMRNFSVDKGHDLAGPNKSKIRSGLDMFEKEVPVNRGGYTTRKSGEGSVKQRDILVKSDESLEEEEFLVDEYESDVELDLASSGPKRKSGATRLGSSSGDDEDTDAIVDGGLKIYFCSRTHSQLSQFVKELKKTRFSSEIRVVCLGSRKNFCINEGIYTFLQIFYL